MTSFTAAKLSRSVRKIVSLTALSRLPPAASAIDLRFSKTWRARSAKSPSTMFMVSGTRGICPDMNTRSPVLTACE
jgi:hypothetical protein